MNKLFNDSCATTVKAPLAAEVIKPKSASAPKLLFRLLQVHALVASITANANASEFELSGSMKFEQFELGKQQPVSTRQVLFQVAVKDCKWFIRTQDPDYPDHGYNVVSYDGQNIYAYTSGRNNAPTNRSVIVSAGSVRTATVPTVGGMRFIPVLWMTLASECYLDDLKQTNSFPPVFSLFKDAEIEQGFTVPASIFRQNQEPRLPSKMIFRDERYRTAVDQSPTNAIYTLIAHTNVDGLLLPTHSELGIYHPPQSKSPETWKLIPYNKYSIEIAECRTRSSVTEFSPDLRKNTFLTDHRTGSTQLNLPRPVQYMSDRWLAVDEVKKTLEYDEQRNLAQQHAALSPKVSTKVARKGIIFAFLTASTIAMFGVLCWYAIKKNNATKTKGKSIQ